MLFEKPLESAEIVLLTRSELSHSYDSIYEHNLLERRNGVSCAALENMSPARFIAFRGGTMRRLNRHMAHRRCVNVREAEISPAIYNHGR